MLAIEGGTLGRELGKLKFSWGFSETGELG